MKPRVSIIISNRNDVSMLVVTIRSCIEELKPLGPGEIIVVDNSDDQFYSLLAKHLPTGYMRDNTLRIYRQNFPCIFTARETAIAEANSDYIICLDSHMLVGKNMILDLVNFMDSHSDDETIGFAHAPINWLHQHPSYSRHDRDMSECEIGNWGLAYNHERTITWKGMPWICRKDFWSKINGYGALSQHKLSWGGGDMHIGIKPWMLGFKNWAVPCSPAIHIGPFPKIDTNPTNPNSVKVATVTARDRYRLWSVSGEGPHSLGFLVSCYVLGGEPMMERNRKQINFRFGEFIDVNHWWDKAITYGEDEKAWLDANKTMTFEELLEWRPWDAN